MRTSAERNNFEQNADVYSGLDTSFSEAPAVDTQEFSLESVQKKLGNIGSLKAEEAVKESDNVDQRPTDGTMGMSFQRHYQVESNTKTASRLSTRAKVAIVLYSMVVLGLILGVAFTSVAVSSVFAENVALTQTYDEAVAQIAELETQIAVEDEAELAQRAAELGYISANEAATETYTRLETRPAQNFNIETNWFDSLCDWLSGVFGG